MIVDRFGRQFRNLRVSLTSSCNYACTYCVAPGQKRVAAAKELDAVELIQAIRLIAQVVSLKKIRITGGEPLLASSFDGLMGEISSLGIDEVSITTNGQLLAGKIPLILSAGIKRINVSLDTLDPSAFRSISRAGDLFSVLSGIEESVAAGLIVKINMVPLRTKNRDQIMPLLEYCLERNIELRFIELMRMGHLRDAALYQRDYVPMADVLQEISRCYPFCRVDAPYDSTAIRFSIPDRGYFGIIANESEPFCSTCTRLRLTSSGYLHGCLSSSERHFIGDLLALPTGQASTLLKERLSLALSNKQLAFSGGETIMRVIGG